MTEETYSKRQVAIVTAICATATFADGFDLQALGVAIPRMATEFAVPASSFSLAGSLAPIGMAFGAMLLSPLADRYGRGTMLAAMLALIGLADLGSLTASSANSIAIWRFIAGLGIGAVVPIAVTLTSAYAPPARRVFLITLMVSFTGVGAFTSGIVAPILADYWGWQGIFAMGTLLSLTSAVLAIVFLPRVGNKAASTGAVAPNATPAKNSIWDNVGKLFQNGFAGVTLLIWALFIFNLCVNFSLIIWLPTLLTSAGWEIGRASQAVSLLAIGGIIGSLTISALADRGWAIRTLACAYLIGIALFLAFGFGVQSTEMWVVMLGMAGLTVFGGQLALSSISAGYYPLAIRSTAVGWMSGVGRLGAIVGPAIVGAMITAEFAANNILAVLAVPIIICFFCAILLPAALARRKST